MTTLHHTWELLDDQGEAAFAIDLEIDYTISDIIRPVVSAPPERCHPEEGGEFDYQVVRARRISETLGISSGPHIGSTTVWSEHFPITEIDSNAFAHLFGEQHDVEQLCRDHAEAEYQDHVERGR